MEGTLFTAGIGARSQIRRWMVVGLGVAAVLILAGAVYLVYDLDRFDDRYVDRVLPGVRVAGLELTGATRAEALAQVHMAEEPERTRRITLHLDGDHWTTTPGELGYRSDAAAQVDAAMAVHDELSTWDRFLIRWEQRRLDRDFEVTAEVPMAPRRQLIERIAAATDLTPTDAELTWTRYRPTVTPEQPGRRVDVDRTLDRLNAAINDRAKRLVEVVAQELHPEVTAEAFRQILFLRQQDHQLDLWIDGRVVRSYTVAVGTGQYPTPTGRYEVTLKRFQPTWVNPDPTGWGATMPARIGPGPNNPLGLRALNWSAPGAIRFHGTADVDSLGRDASHGCVRLSNPDVIELYDLVDEGAVIISAA